MSFFYPFDSLVRLADISDLLEETAPPKQRGQRPVTQFVPSFPKMDLIDGKDTMTAVVELPGLAKDAVDISLHDNVLTISGKVEHTNESKDEGSSYKFTERSYGSFSRSLGVPSGLKESEIKASLVDGLLKVEIPKAARDSATKKITIA